MTDKPFLIPLEDVPLRGEIQNQRLPGIDQLIVVVVGNMPDPATLAQIAKVVETKMTLRHLPPPLLITEEQVHVLVSDAPQGQRAIIELVVGELERIHRPEVSIKHIRPQDSRPWVTLKQAPRSAGKARRR